MKKIFSLILAFVLLICSAQFIAIAEVVEYKNFEGFVYTDNDVTDGYVRITNYKGEKTKVTIPTEIKGKKVFSMSRFGKIKQLHIPDGVLVLYIAKAKNLEKITVNKTNKKYSVKNNLLLNKKKTILYGCPRKNTNPKIPNTVKTIEHSAFYGAKFKKISLPKNLKTIGYYAFSNCKKLESIKFPKNLKTIDNQAFLGCNSLKTIKIPDSVKRVNSYAFSECKNLKKVTLGKGIKYIADAFTRCKSLKEIEIPKTVEKIGNYAFSDYDAIERIYIYNENCNVYYKKHVAGNGYTYYSYAIPKHVTIYGHLGSTAQKYAKKNGNEFVVLK